MTTNWLAFPDFNLPPGQFIPLWQLAVDIVEGVNHLRFHAYGQWTLPSAQPVNCGPDGLSGAPATADSILLPGSNVGCLIGRFGGSSAGGKAAPPSADVSGIPTEMQPGVSQVRDQAQAGMVFPIGIDCLFKVPAGVFGPLFIGFNIVERPIDVKQLNLTISGATLG